MTAILKEIFLAHDRKLRPIWRSILYYTIGTFVIFPLLGRPLAFIGDLFHVRNELTAGLVTLAELRNFLVA